jgi:hypothetical protein
VPAAPILRTRRLRPLTLARGAQVAAASGLVCADGRAWVIADDSLHLARFDAAHGPGHSLRLLPGRLPADAKARKRAKPDFEVLFAWQGRLIALGSGSRPQRCRGVAHADGAPPRVFDLEPLYAPLRARWGEVNIEGAFVQHGRLALLQRAVDGRTPNAVARWPEAVLDALLRGALRRAVPPTDVQAFELGALDGVSLGFTDATALNDGRWLYAAAAEATRDSYADGACVGSVVGLVSADGRAREQRRVAGRAKVEGLAAHREPDGSLALALVTDADDPRHPAWLLRARWRA